MESPEGRAASPQVVPESDDRRSGRFRRRKVIRRPLCNKSLLPGHPAETSRGGLFFVYPISDTETIAIEPGDGAAGEGGGGDGLPHWLDRRRLLGRIDDLIAYRVASRPPPAHEHLHRGAVTRRTNAIPALALLG